MEPTVTGPNRTGAAVNPDGVAAMLEAVEQLSPPTAINTRNMDVERQRYISEADSVGSIPPAQPSLQGKSTKKKSANADPNMALLLDKLGERLAFERTGTRLYGAVITKYLAIANGGEEPLAASDDGEPAIKALGRIRDEELQHFRMLSECITELGGDPTSQTPCADVTATASMGLLQVVTDPRTTLAQCLNAVLTAELTDNAGWELLSELAELSGKSELATRFAEAHAVEEEHLVTVQTWLRALMTDASGTAAV